MSTDEPRPRDDDGSESEPTPSPPPPATGQPSAPDSSRSGPVSPGGALHRLGARILDGVIVGIPLGLLSLVLPGLDVGGVAYSVVSSIVGFGYFVYLESNRGETLGKKILGLRVTDEGGGSPITPEASVRRNWWMLLGVLAGAGILGFLASLASLGIAIAIGVTIGSDEKNRGFHDRMAGTAVFMSR